MSKRILSAAVLSLGSLVTALGGVAWADEAKVRLSPAEIRSELVGRQIVWWQDGGWLAGHLILSDDGSAEIFVDHPDRSVDRGRWSVRGGELCTEWTGLRSGAEKCYGVHRSDGGRFLTSGGNVFEIRETGV